MPEAITRPPFPFRSSRLCWSFCLQKSVTSIYSIPAAAAVLVVLFERTCNASLAPHESANWRLLFFLFLIFYLLYHSSSQHYTPVAKHKQALLEIILQRRRSRRINTEGFAIYWATCTHAWHLGGRSQDSPIFAIRVHHTRPKLITNTLQTLNRRGHSLSAFPESWSPAILSWPYKSFLCSLEVRAHTRYKQWWPFTDLYQFISTIQRVGEAY